MLLYSQSDFDLKKKWSKRKKKVKIQLYADEMNHMPILKQNNYKFTKKKDKKDKNNVRKNVMYEVSDEVAQNYL